MLKSDGVVSGWTISQTAVIEQIVVGYATCAFVRSKAAHATAIAKSTSIGCIISISSTAAFGWRNTAFGSDIIEVKLGGGCRVAA